MIKHAPFRDAEKISNKTVKAIVNHQPSILAIAEDLGLTRQYVYQLISEDPKYKTKRFTEDNLAILRSKGYPV